MTKEKIEQAISALREQELQDPGSVVVIEHGQFCEVDLEDNNCNCFPKIYLRAGE